MTGSTFTPSCANLDDERKMYIFKAAILIPSSLLLIACGVHKGQEGSLTSTTWKCGPAIWRFGQADQLIQDSPGDLSSEMPLARISWQSTGNYSYRRGSVLTVTTLRNVAVGGNASDLRAAAEAGVSDSTFRTIEKYSVIKDEADMNLKMSSRERNGVEKKLQPDLRCTKICIQKNSNFGV